MSKTFLVALSGKKGGGKNTVAGFLRRNAREVFGLSPREVVEYAFADPIKRFATDTLGLSFEQCHGNNDQKNTPTPYRWEDMPFYDRMLLNETYRRLQNDFDPDDFTTVLAGVRQDLPSGVMTAREVLQTLGTEVGRSYDPDLWTKALMRQVERESPAVAVITDLRFPNEFDAVKGFGGVVVRLTRDPNPGDTHPSETLLDRPDFDWSRFDLVVDNPSSPASLTCREVANFLQPRWISGNPLRRI